MNTSDIRLLAWIREAAASGEAQEIRGQISRAEISAVVGVTPDAIGRWERGERVPTGAPALKYARVIAKLRDERTRLVAQ